MLRRSVFAVVAVLVLGGFLLAETVLVLITKVDGDKVTANVREKGKKEKGEEKTFTLTDKTEYLLRKGKDAEPEKSTKDNFLKAVEKGAEGKLKGIAAALDVDGGKINKVTFGGGKKKDN